MEAIYEAEIDEGFELCQPVNHADFENALVSVSGSPSLSDWQPMPVEIIREDEGRKLKKSDSPWFGSYALVFRRKAVEALGPLLLDNGELLPLDCPEAELWMFNATRVLDALDEKKSEIIRFSTGRVMAIERYAFRPEVIEGADVFKIPQFRASPTFVSQRFRDAWKAAKLRGLDFKPIWP